MPVETIECQIVQAQLGRYLTGDTFSPEAVSEIEAHVSTCSICRAEVAQRRAALQSLLGGSVAETNRVNAESLIEALREKSPSHAVVETSGASAQTMALNPLNARNLSKPLMYGTALALVLLGMSYFGKNATSILGDRASNALPAAAIAEPSVQPKEVAAATPEISEPIGSSEWDALGLESSVPFEVETSSLMEPWEWYALAASLEPYEDLDAEPATIDAADTGLETSAAPTRSANPPAVVAKVIQPAKAKPRAATPVRPKNSVRVYAPTN
jgi:hypothetical protein